MCELRLPATMIRLEGVKSYFVAFVCIFQNDFAQGPVCLSPLSTTVCTYFCHQAVRLALLCSSLMGNVAGTSTGIGTLVPVYIM